MDDQPDQEINDISLSDIDSIIEDCTPYHKLEWLCHRRIVVFSASGSAARPVVDAWAEMITNVVEQWPKDQPLLVLVDLINASITTSAYQRARNADLMRLNSGLEAFVAFVLPDSFVAKLARLLVMRYKRENSKMQFFQNRENAILWLLRSSGTKPERKKDNR